MIYLQALTLFLALYFSIRLVSVWIAFIGKAITRQDAVVGIADMVIPAVLWALFYMVTR